jgi:AcrR family transcriptional regulator
MRKGYAATKTRDIAESAGINLALVNYYFRSKENLFHEIMLESIQSFMSGIFSVFFDEKSTLQEKLETLASNYIDFLIQQPTMPLFILSELRTNPEKFITKISAGAKMNESVLHRQLSEEIGKERLGQLNPIHVLINLLGMIVFPFLARPMLELSAQVDQEQFKKLMNERKALIPNWIMDMLR